MQKNEIGYFVEHTVPKNVDITAAKMMIKKTAKKLNPVAVEISNLKFEGNIIPHRWLFCDDFRRKNKLIDLPAIILLADLVYWYRLTEIKEEETGIILGYKHKFRADKLQKYYLAWAKSLGLTERQTREAAYRLRKKGYITIELRKRVLKGRLYGNVPFFEPVPEKIKAITQIPSTATTVEGEEPITSDGHSPITPGRENTKITNTKTTTTEKAPRKVSRGFILTLLRGTVFSGADPDKIVNAAQKYSRSQKEIEIIFDVLEQQYKSPNEFEDGNGTKLLVAALRDRYRPPEGYVSRAQREAEVEQKREAANLKAAEERKAREAENNTFDEAEAKLFALPKEERERIFLKAKSNLPPLARNSKIAVKTEAIRMMIMASNL